jgi:hypothetical protein
MDLEQMQHDLTLLTLSGRQRVAVAFLTVEIRLPAGWLVLD